MARNRVNPPKQVVLPPKVASDLQLKKAFDDVYHILFQMWKRTGAGDDFIDGLVEDLHSTKNSVSRNTAQIGSIDLQKFEVVPITVSTTTEPFQILICKNTTSIDVALDPLAIIGDRVHIKRRGGKIKVIGAIDGKDFEIINVKQFSAHYVFDGTDWSRV
jgi:hypothetical protein